MVGSSGLFSKRSLRGPNMFSSRNLVCSCSCNQDLIFKIRDRGSSFASMVSFVTSFSKKREDSKEVLIVYVSV